MPLYLKTKSSNAGKLTCVTGFSPPGKGKEAVDTHAGYDEIRLMYVEPKPAMKLIVNNLLILIVIFNVIVWKTVTGFCFCLCSFKRILVDSRGSLTAQIKKVPVTDCFVISQVEFG